MPVINGVGQSNHTLTKQMILKDIINSVYRPIYGLSEKNSKKGLPAKVIFNWIDTNAGTGYNVEFGCDGSPVIFQNEMIQKNYPYRMYCIEKNRENINELQKTLIPSSNITFVNGNHNSAIKNVLSDLKQKKYQQYGILYHDPNGYPSWDMLIESSNRWETAKLDYLIHIAATTIKRVVNGLGKDSSLLDMISKIDKRYWYIRECHYLGSDATQWCFLLGTNYKDYSSLKSIGFKRVDTSSGESIMNIFNHTKSTSYSNMVLSQKPLSAFVKV